MQRAGEGEGKGEGEGEGELLSHAAARSFVCLRVSVHLCICASVCLCVCRPTPAAVINQFASLAGGKMSLPPKWAMGMKYDPRENGDNETFVPEVLRQFAERGIRPDRAILEPAWQNPQHVGPLPLPPCGFVRGAVAARAIAVFVCQAACDSWPPTRHGVPG